MSEDVRPYLTEIYKIWEVLQIVSGRECPRCEYNYEKIDDIEERKPRRGYGEDIAVCDGCWEGYEKSYTDFGN